MIMKKKYITPATEELQEALQWAILDDSADGERNGYDYGGQFDW